MALAKEVHISVAGGSCFFHILGDRRRYYDLDSLRRGHPELKDSIDEKKYELQGELMKRREMMGVSDRMNI